MTAAAFLALVLACAAGLVAATARWGGRRAASGLAFVLAAWLAAIGALGSLGVLADPTLRPPGMLVIAVPMALLAGWLALSGTAGRIAGSVPLAVLIGAQGFRLAVEVLLHQLGQAGIVPRTLTWEGANFDIVIGLTAPLAAWIASRGATGRRIALAWNFAGLAMLANVVVRSVASSPGFAAPDSIDVPNRLVALFPYFYLPGLMVPLALALHVLAIRALIGSAPTPDERGLEHRVPPPLVFAMLAVAMALASWRLPASGLGGPVSLALGVALLVLAGLFGPPAILRFRRAGTTIDPVAIERASVLVTDGVYRRSRNPMYVAMAALLAAGAAFAAQPWLLLGPVAFVAWVTRLQILPEERVMQARFGDAYAAYRRDVRRWL